MKKTSTLLAIFCLLAAPIFSQKAAQQLLRHANKAAEIGDFRRADSLATEVLEKKHLSKALKNQARSELGFYKTQLAQFAQAVPLLADAESYFQKFPGEDDSDLTTIWARLGSVAMEQKDFQKAAIFFTRAKNLRERHLPARHLDFVISLDQLGELFLETERLDEATEILAKAAQLAPPRHWLHAQILNNIARVESEQSQFGAAEKNLRQSIDLQKKLARTEHPLFAKTLMNLANIQAELGQLDAAKTNYEAAARLVRWRLGEQHPDFAKAINNLGTALEKLGNFAEAARCYRQATDIFEKNGPKEDFLIAQYNVGTMYKQNRQPDSAVIFLEKNLIEWEQFKGTQNIGFAWIQIILAESLANAGDPATFDRACSLAQSANLLYVNLMTESHANVPEFSLKQAFVLQKAGRLDEAKKQYARTANLVERLAREVYPILSDADRGVFLRENLQRFSRSIFRFGTKNPGTLDREMLQLEAALKGLSLEMSRIAQLQALVAGDADLFAAFEKWQNARSRLVAAHFSEEKGRVDTLHQTANLLEKELNQLVFKKGKNAPPNRNALAQNLPEGAAVVNYFKSQGVYFAIVRTADTLATVRLDSVFAVDVPLTLTVGKYDKTPIYVIKKEVRRRLSEQLWHPIEPFLKNVHTVFISPTGRLHRLAFYMLPPASGEPFLLEKYEIKICLSPADVRPGQKISWQNRRVDLFGGVFFDSKNDDDSSVSDKLLDFEARAGETKLSRGASFEFLPGTLVEVDSLAKFFKKNGWQAAKYTGISASETQLRNKPANRAEILHLATHGFSFAKIKLADGANTTLENSLHSADSPMLRSCILLAGANKALNSAESVTPESDGIVSALEIGGMDFSSVRLVVLSACETARGDADDTEGVFGLQRGFRQAGAGTLLASLWQVPDLATSRLMLLFYENLLQSNDPHEALRQAQLAMNGAGLEPFFWAGFVVLD